MIVSPSWFSLLLFCFLSLCWILFCLCVCLLLCCLSVLLSAWWGLWAEALVQKSGSSSVLAEGKPESCGKMLLLEWMVWQLHLYMLLILVWNLPLDVYVKQESFERVLFYFFCALFLEIFSSLLDKTLTQAIMSKYK